MRDDNSWTIINTRHSRQYLAQHNSVFTISNGYLGLKGNLQEDRDEPRPVTLINGVYDEIDQFGTIRASNRRRPYLDPREFDAAGKSPAVANLPNPLLVRVFVADREISLARGQISDFSQSLDLRTGLYRYAFNYRDAGGRTTRIEMARFTAISRPHRVFMRYSVTPIDHDSPIQIYSGIDGNVASSITGERQFTVCDAVASPASRCVLCGRTRARKHEVHLAVHNTNLGIPFSTKPSGVVEHDAVYTRYEFRPARGQTISIERYIVLAASEDARHGVAVDLESELNAACAQGFEAAFEEQRAAWANLWERADIKIDGDRQAQRYLRFCLYHLLAAAPRHTDKLSVPVKLLSGEHYQGNVFADTDLYIVPFYSLTFPAFARSCLEFRYRGLSHGRAIAAQLGCRGAKFAWQAGPYGEECLGNWYRFVHTNIHIDADVACALMLYYWATGDELFMRQRGVDILVETARFYCSRAIYDALREGLTFEDVAGPDEAHCGSKSNFYTNCLAQKNLRWAAQILERLRSEKEDVFNRVAKRLEIQPDEPERWQSTADKLILLFDPQSKLYEQCEGFFSLPPMPSNLLADRREWFAPIFSYQAMNQPDVVMALTLLRDDFDEEVRRANWRYYQPRSMNFSSMSFAINAIAAADAGEVDEAYRNFMITAGLDLDERLTGRHDTHAGLHGGALGGAWLAVVFGFGGVSLSERGVRIDPKLPPQWKSLNFKLILRGALVSVAIERSEMTISAGTETDVEIPLLIAGQKHLLRSGRTLRIAGDYAGAG